MSNHLHLQQQHLTAKMQPVSYPISQLFSIILFHDIFHELEHGLIRTDLVF
jgi:hypothetical protein